MRPFFYSLFTLRYIFLTAFSWCRRRPSGNWRMSWSFSIPPLPSVPRFPRSLPPPSRCGEEPHANRRRGRRPGDVWNSVHLVQRRGLPPVFPGTHGDPLACNCEPCGYVRGVRGGNGVSNEGRRKRGRNWRGGQGKRVGVERGLVLLELIWSDVRFFFFFFFTRGRRASIDQWIENTESFWRSCWS